MGGPCAWVREATKRPHHHHRWGQAFQYQPRELVLRHGGKYNPVSGGFFFPPQDQSIIAKFLERFPIKTQLAQDKGSPQSSPATSAPSAQEPKMSFPGGTVRDNPEDNYIHFIFDAKITILSRNGFTFSSAANAWSRTRRAYAYDAAQRVVLFINNARSADHSRER